MPSLLTTRKLRAGSRNLREEHVAARLREGQTVRRRRRAGYTLLAKRLDDTPLRRNKPHLHPSEDDVVTRQQRKSPSWLRDD